MEKQPVTEIIVVGIVAGFAAAGAGCVLGYWVGSSRPGVPAKSRPIAAVVAKNVAASPEDELDTLPPLRTGLTPEMVKHFLIGDLDSWAKLRADQRLSICIYAARKEHPELTLEKQIELGGRYFDAIHETRATLSRETPGTTATPIDVMGMLEMFDDALQSKRKTEQP